MATTTERSLRKAVDRPKPLVKNPLLIIDLIDPGTKSNRSTILCDVLMDRAFPQTLELQQIFLIDYAPMLFRTTSHNHFMRIFTSWSQQKSRSNLASR